MRNVSETSYKKCGGTMTVVRWFDGVECTECEFPLFFDEDTTGGCSIYSPASSLVIQCTNPACGLEEDCYGRTHKKFRVGPQ